MVYRSDSVSRTPQAASLDEGRCRLVPGNALTEVCARCVSDFVQEGGMPLNLEDKKVLVAEVNASAAKTALRWSLPNTVDSRCRR